MSYNTRYKIRIYSGQLPSFQTQAIAAGYITLEKLIYDEATKKYSNPFDQECSWYDHEDNMVYFSKGYPDAIFELSGEGEESGDVWKKYFKNGRYVSIYPELIWPEFDPNDLMKDP